MRKIFFFFFLFLCSAANAAHPIFGDYQNSFRAEGFRTTDFWSDGAGHLMLTYSQPSTWWRLEGRRNVHIMRFVGRTRGAHPMYLREQLGVSTGNSIAQWAIGYSHDIIFWQPRNFFFGAGIGGFVKEQKNDFGGSRWMWGERIFIGYRAGRMHFEFALTHYSNGRMHKFNHGVNSFGFGIGWAF